MTLNPGEDDCRAREGILRCTTVKRVTHGITAL